MIRPYNDESQTAWNHGKLQVQLMVTGSARPVGFCDGSDQDLAELREIAEAEGAEEFVMTRKLLKTGREIWTLGSETPPDDIDF